MTRILVIVALVSVACASLARAQVAEGWGFRVGVLDAPIMPGARPLLQLNYETATARSSSLTLLGDLTLAFIDFGKFQIPSYDEHTIFDYGFHGGVRKICVKSGLWQGFWSALVGFDVFPDPQTGDPGFVCASIPLSIGVLRELGGSSQLEVEAMARPVWYFRQSWGGSFCVTAGVRFY